MSEDHMAPMTDTERQELRGAAERATPGDLDTIPKPNSEYGGYDTGVYDCPCCGGDGSVAGETFTNFDAVAMGVQFFGIGNEFKNYEAFFRLANPAAILSLLDERDALSEQVEGLTRERDDLIGSVAAHVTVRGEYYARAQAAESLTEALTRENEGLRAKGQTLLAALAVNGWPVSDEHWRRASGQMSIQARALHLAATDFKAALASEADEPAKGEAMPEPPFPADGGNNARRVGWNSFHLGLGRNSHPFPPLRLDLRAEYEEGWDAAQAALSQQGGLG